MAMRQATFKFHIRIVAARLSIVVLALAMGIGAAGAIFHPRLLNAMQRPASASGLACKATPGKSTLRRQDGEASTLEPIHNPPH